ncbi:MAG: peptidoglycan recognition family protein [Candidatus Alcyoniella australis]|nr:peptidoglycan recognition family protein [Candidatus Alcyoniella australis]
MRNQMLQLLDLRHRLPVHSSKHWRRREIDQIRCVVTHQSLGSAAELEPGLLTRYLAAYHVKSDPRGTAYGRNWPGLAYHFCIEPCGALIWANDLESVTYHTGGARNRDGVGIVICGDFDGPGHAGKHQPTAAQHQAWLRLMAWLEHDLQIAPAQIYGHCDAPGGTLKAACPGYVVHGWIKSYSNAKQRQKA